MNDVGSVLLTPEFDQRQFLNEGRDESEKKSLLVDVFPSFKICR